MDKSESIKELATALSKFQGETNNAFKGKQGHGHAYADLASILEQSRPLLAANGLSVVQMPANAEAGHIAVETAILHSSGEWLEQVYAMPIPENKRNSGAQNMGSAITYARRYALAAALGIAQTDDDASLNEAVEQKPSPEIAEIQGWINAGNSAEVQANWSGKIADSWKMLNDRQIEALNILINQKELQK